MRRKTFLTKKSPKKIYILDCDFFYKTSTIPNYRAMKLYSYHSQIGDKPIFITESWHLTNTHDVLYLIRELRHTPIPPGDVLDDRRTILMGKEFQIFEDVQDIPHAAAICRPAYDLYKYDEPNIYQNASFVQFFNQGVYLKNMQDWHRPFSKATVIVDTNLWDAPPSYIVEAFETLKDEPTIVFLHPIKLKKLTNPEVFEAFKRLKLAKLYKIRYNNNIGEDYSSMTKVIDVIQELRENFPYLTVGVIPVKIITKDHWESKENIYHDFERCLKIMAYAQSKRVRINFKYPTMRLASPSWHYFEFFKTWSNHFHRLGYIEARLKKTMEFYKSDVAGILNNSRRWNTSRIKETVHLVARYPDLIREYGFKSWGGVVDTAVDKIDFNYIKEKAIEDHIF